MFGRLVFDADLSSQISLLKTELPRQNQPMCLPKTQLRQPLLCAGVYLFINLLITSFVGKVGEESSFNNPVSVLLNNACKIIFLSSSPT